MCANLVDPAPASAARSCDAALGLSAGHGPLRAARGRSLTTAAALGLLAGHGPLCVARRHCLVATTTPGLLAKHRPLHAARGRNPAAAAELWWTCGQDSSEINNISEAAAFS